MANKKALTNKPAPKPVSRVSGARPVRANVALIAAVADAMAKVKAARGALVASGLGKMSQEQREHTTGKLRVGEDDAMTCVLDTVDAKPELFTSIADKDHGTDDAAVETQPARDALAERAALLPLAVVAAELVQLVSDAVLERGAVAKDVTVAAYRIIAANAPLNPAVAKAGADALTFYGRNARKGAQTRKNKPKPPAA